MNRHTGTNMYLNFIIKIFKLNILCRILNFVIKITINLYCSVIETSYCMFAILPFKSSNGKMCLGNLLKMINKYKINRSTPYSTYYRHGLGHKLFSNLNAKPGSNNPKEFH